MKIVSIAVIANALSASAAPAFTIPLSEEAVANANFEDWQARQGTGLAVLEVDLHTGDIEAVEVQELGSVATGTLIPAEDSTQVSIPGQVGAVVESPEFSTDVPDEAGVQTAADSDELEEAEETAEAPLRTPDPFLIRLQILLDSARVTGGNRRLSGGEHAEGHCGL